MFQAGVYKRSQGQVVRQVTFAAVAITLALGAWRLYEVLLAQTDAVRYLSSGGLLLFGLWFAFRLVNYPRFADFFIAVEAEMNKVSWPTRTELWRSAMVVIVVIFVMAIAVIRIRRVLAHVFLQRCLGLSCSSPSAPDVQIAQGAALEVHG